MSQTLLRQKLNLELPLINKALAEAVAGLPEPCRPIASHILDAGGKRLRPLLTILCAAVCGSPDNSEIRNLAASMEMLHAATLLHDDVLDNAACRRGEPAAHTLHGAAATILTGDALLAAGNAIVASYGNAALVACYSRATTQTAAGEILEMSSLRDPTLSHAAYLEIARGKTACLISQACALGALAAGARPDFVDICATYGENLGMAFQLVDDALDFEPGNATGKPLGGDLREGKMTPPLRLYRESLDADARQAFDCAFATATFAPGEAEAIIQAVAAFAPRARALADDCLTAAINALARLPRGEDNSILLQMCEYVRDRRN